MKDIYNIESLLNEIKFKLENLESIMNVLNSNHNKNVSTPEPETDPEPYIYGIIGLAKFLNVTPPTAQKIKNSGRIPYSQAQRTIIFKKDDILKALSINTIGRNAK